MLIPIARDSGRGLGHIEDVATQWGSERCRNWHAWDNFLMEFTLSGMTFSEQILEQYTASQQHECFNVQDLLPLLQSNQPVYELLWTVLHILVPYVSLRRAVHECDGEAVVKWMQYWTPLFWVARKRNYWRLGVTFLRSLQLLTPEWRKAALNQLTIKLHKNSLGMGADAFIEWHHWQVKRLLTQDERNVHGIQQVTKRLQGVMKILNEGNKFFRQYDGQDSKNGIGTGNPRSSLDQSCLLKILKSKFKLLDTHNNIAKINVHHPGPVDFCPVFVQQHLESFDFEKEGENGEH